MHERLTATLLTHALTPAQLPVEGGGVELEVCEAEVVVLEVLVVCEVVVGGGGALAPPVSAAFTPASKRPLARRIH